MRSASAASLVQKATGITASGTSVSATFASDPTPGNLLVAVVGVGSNVNIIGPAAGAGWTQAVKTQSNVSQAIYYKIAGTGESRLVSATTSATGALGMHIYEYSGAITLAAPGTALTGNNTPPGTGLTVTTTAANELIFEAFTTNKNSAIDDASWYGGANEEGFAEQNDFPNGALNVRYAAGDSLANSPGTHGAVVTTATAGRWVGQIVRFQADTTAPTVSNVTSSTTNGTYPVGTVIPIQVTFSEVVNVTNVPTLTLSTGSPATTTVNYTSGTGTNTLTFNYTVASGNVSSDLDYSSVAALATTGASIKDAAGNDATLTLPSPGAAGSLGANKALVIEGTIPTVTNVTSTLADGTYGIGQVVPIQVTFSENVTVAGNNPTLLLATGTPPSTAATYTGGSPGTTLSFTFTVVAGNATSDLDYFSTDALSTTGTIKDAAGNNAALALPAPGAAGSLGANKNILFDAQAPTVVLSTTASEPTRTFPIPVTATFSENVLGFTDTDVVVTNGTVTGFTPVSGSVYAISVTPSGQGAVTVSVPADRAQDAAGNNNTVSNTLSRTYDGIAPTVSLSTAVTSPTNQSDIPYTATFSEPVTGFIDTDIAVTNATVGDFVPVSGTVYTFDVYPIGDPDEAVTVTVSVPAGRAQDTAGNDNFASDGGTPKTIVFDGHTPTVTLTSTAPASTAVSPIPVTATFSEDVTGLLSTEISTSNGAVADFVPVSARVYTFNLVPSGQGAVTATVPPGAAQDVGSNSNLISNTLTRTYDTVAPTVTLTTTASEPTRTSPIPVTATFSENVTGLLDTEIAVTNGSVSGFTPVSGTVYAFSVNPGGQGAVTVSIPASSAQDAANNNSAVSNALTRTYDTVAPTLAQVSAVPTPTSDTTPNYVFSSNEAGTISYAGSCSSATTAAVSGNNTITFSTLSEGQHNDCAVAVTDAAGNVSTWLVTNTFTVDTMPPVAVADLALSAATASSVTLTWTAPADPGPTGRAASYDVRYSTASITGDATFAAAMPVSGEPVPTAAGSVQTMTVSGLVSDTTYYFAMKSADGALNVSALSNGPSLKTLVGTSGSPGGRTGSSADLSLIIKANPEVLPAGGGDVAFTYVVRNLGDLHVANVAVTVEPGMLPCAPVKYVSGDADADGTLDPGSEWTYACTTRVTASGIHTAVATGFWNFGNGRSAPASVYVLVGETTSAANVHFHVTSFPAVLHAAGDVATLEYEVGNIGGTPISGIRFSDAPCKLSELLEGDENHNGLLDPDEEWSYVCVGNFAATTEFPVTFTGRAGDVDVSDLANVTVSVGDAAPHPNIHLHVTANPARLPVGGGTTYLTYYVSNNGNAPLSEISLLSGSRTCHAPSYASGDADKDAVLDIGEIWIYTCVEELDETEADSAVVRGRTDNRWVSDNALFIVPVATKAPPQVDPNATGGFDPASAYADTPDIDTDLGLEKALSAVACAIGVPYKVASDNDPDTQEDTTVYYCGRDGKRHPFLNFKMFLSWYPNFNNIVVVAESVLRAIPLGEAALYRPGSRMVKTTEDAKVYAVARGGLLRWVADEAVAASLYGKSWASMIDDVPKAFIDEYYRFGDKIEALAQ